MRSEAQKKADKAYREKNADKYKNFNIHLPTAEAEEIDKLIAEKKITKADFARKAADHLRNDNL